MAIFAGILFLINSSESAAASLITFTTCCSLTIFIQKQCNELYPILYHSREILTHQRVLTSSFSTKVNFWVLEELKYSLSNL